MWKALVVSAIVACSLCSLAWSDDLAPIDPKQWDAAKAAHLLRRAGFGGTPGEIALLGAMTPRKAVSYLLDYEKLPAPAEFRRQRYDARLPAVRSQIQRRATRLAKEAMRDLNVGGGTAVQKLFEVGTRVEATSYYGERHDRQQIQRLRSWWVVRMLGTRRPLEEKMTLFWHGHFATGWEKVRDTGLMARQNRVLRRHATGSFAELLREIARDPAMLRYLDGNLNVRSHPNENFARELMELFTLGIGNYTEKDVKEAARAFTGWTFRLPWDGPHFAFDAGQHDPGAKQFLGRSGAFGGDDIIRILLESPATANRLATKLLRFFACQDPDPRWVAGVARTLRTNRYALKPTLRQLFLSRAFYGDRVVGKQIKSPVELLVGTARLLGTPDRTVGAHGTYTLRRMGQHLFEPVNVKGWDGGTAWINPATMLERYNLAAALVRGDRGAGPLGTHLKRYGTADKRTERLTTILLAAPIAPDKRARLRKLDARAALLLVTSTPEYQLN